MADRTITERLQPSILDRLRDDEPEKKAETQGERVIDLARLRNIIRRDLAWLLNTSNMGSEIDPETYPNVAKSVVNYGVREITGEFSTMRRAELIRESIRRSVETFEPRIIDGTLDVLGRMEDKGSSRAVMVFDIVADLWAQPLPVELYLRSEFDVTTGQVDLKQAG